jgi:hypothetical protein
MKAWTLRGGRKRHDEGGGDTLEYLHNCD